MLKNSNCDQTQIVTKLKISKYDKTPKKKSQKTFFTKIFFLTKYIFLLPFFFTKKTFSFLKYVFTN